jgi:hypothetical protein
VNEKISFKDPNGKHLSGLLNVSGGRITVTAPDGRTKTAAIEESMLSPEILAKVLLLQLQQEERQDGVSQWRLAANIANEAHKMTLTKEEVELLKQLKGAGERGRTIRAFETRVRLERLVRAGYVADQPTGPDLVHYRITKRGEAALSGASRPV